VTAGAAGWLLEDTLPLVTAATRAVEVVAAAAAKPPDGAAVTSTAA
jgi:hypothetical protein